MALTPADFKARFPNFVPVDDVRVQLFIDDAINDISETIFKACKIYERAVCYLAAHYLTLNERTNRSGTTGGSVNAGPLSSKAADRVSQSYGSIGASGSTLNDLYYMQTPYGFEFLRLRNSCVNGEIVISGC